MRFLKYARRTINKQWRERKAWMPIDVSMALFELTQQHIVKDEVTYLGEMRRYFHDVFGVTDLSEEVLQFRYTELCRFVYGALPPIICQVEAALQRLPQPHEYETSKAEAAFVSWVGWCEENVQSFTTSPNLLLGIVLAAVTGNQNAMAFLKLRELKKSPALEVASNVAWDLLFVPGAMYQGVLGPVREVLFCTMDRRLAELSISFLPGMHSSYLNRSGMPNSGAHHLNPVVFGQHDLIEKVLVSQALNAAQLRLRRILADHQQQFVNIDPRDLEASALSLDQRAIN